MYRPSVNCQSSAERGSYKVDLFSLPREKTGQQNCKKSATRRSGTRQSLLGVNPHK